MLYYFQDGFSANVAAGKNGKNCHELPIHTVVFSGWFEQNRRWKDGGKYYDRKSYYNAVFSGWFKQKRRCKDGRKDYDW